MVDVTPTNLTVEQIAEFQNMYVENVHKFITDSLILQFNPDAGVGKVQQLAEIRKMMGFAGNEIFKDFIPAAPVYQPDANVAAPVITENNFIFTNN